MRIRALVAGCAAASLAALLPACGAAAPNGDPGLDPSTLSATLAAAPGLVLEGSETDLAMLPAAAQRQHLAAMHAAGADWIKLTVSWMGHEPRPGVYNWYLTPVIREIEAAGMHVDALLSNPPGWAGPDDGRAPSPAAFASFAAAVARTYGALGVQDFEVWNEENTRQSWGQGLSPARYTVLLRAASAAIRSVDTDATVIVGGLAPAPDAPDGSSYEPYTYLAGMYRAGAAGLFDAVADHPYSYPDLPDQTSDAWNPFAYLPRMHAIMAAHGDGAKPIWLTEVGAPVGGVRGAVTPQVQAETITQAFRFGRAHDWIGPLLVADWRDSVHDVPRLPFGLLDLGGDPRPAFFAFERAAADRRPS